MATKNLAGEAYRLIKLRIVHSGRYPDMYLSEEKLMSILKIGRTPIREAIVRLKHEGFLTVIPRKGIFINFFSESQLRQIYEMAEALEGMAVKLVTQRITEKRRERLERVVEEMEKAFENNDQKKWVACDIKVHRLIQQMSGNKYISEAMALINERIKRIRTLWLQVQGLPVKSTQEHRQIVEAIKSRDPAMAQKLMQEHMERVRKNIITIFRGMKVF